MEPDFDDMDFDYDFFEREDDYNVYEENQLMMEQGMEEYDDNWRDFDEPEFEDEPFINYDMFGEMI